MSLDEIKQTSDRDDKKMGSKVDKEAAKKLRLQHMRNILIQKENAGLPLSDAERARLILLKDLSE